MDAPQRAATDCGGLEHNDLLAKIPECERAALARHAEFLELPAGATLTQPGERTTSVYFPTSGVVSVISTSRAGRHYQLAAVGSEGLVGLGTILNIQPSPFWYTALLDSAGYGLTEDQFRHAFSELPDLRRETLAYTGRVLLRTGRTAVCNRFHTQEQRLARWLIEIKEKSGLQAFNLTHEAIAQFMGAPRHAVTAALGALRLAGAVTYGRGRLAVVDRERLAKHACDCFKPT